MRLGLDTSVVLRLLVGEPQPLAERAWQVIVETRAARGEIVVSDLVVSEAYFARLLGLPFIAVMTRSTSPEKAR